MCMILKKHWLVKISATQLLIAHKRYGNIELYASSVLSALSKLGKMFSHNNYSQQIFKSFVISNYFTLTNLLYAVQHKSVNIPRSWE